MYNPSTHGRRDGHADPGPDHQANSRRVALYHSVLQTQANFHAGESVAQLDSVMDQAAATMDWPVGAVGPGSRPIWPVQSAAGPPVLGSGWSVHGQVHRGLDSGPNAWSISQSIDPVEGPAQH